MYKKITFLTLLLLSINTIFCMHQPFFSRPLEMHEEFDPVKIIVTSAFDAACQGYTLAARRLQSYNRELIISGAIAATALVSGTVAINWWQTKQERDRLHDELSSEASNDYKNVTDGDSKTFTLYQSFPAYAQDAKLGTLVTEFNTFFKEKNKKKLLEKRNELILFVAEEKGLLF